MFSLKSSRSRLLAASGVALYLGVLGAASPTSAAADAPRARCTALAGLRVDTGRIETAEHVLKGARLVSEEQSGQLAALNGITAPVDFCRVRTRLHPTRDSDILVEAWLPDNWKGKLLGVGGGGFSGGYATAAISLRGALEQGYAGVSTDVGHPATESAKWAFGHQQKLIDYAYRGNHLAAVVAKQAITAFYGTPAKRTYFHGCSNGGRDALMEVSRFPQDYDGVIAGAPAASWTPMLTSFVANRRALFGPSGASKLGTKLSLINNAVVAKCDALDGVSDGILEDPRKCQFDPAELQCKPGAGESNSCLSAAEVGVARQIYQGTFLKSGKQLMSGFAVGSEASGWDEWLTSEKSLQSNFGDEFFRWMVHGDASWDMTRFDIDRDFAAAQSQVGFLNSDNSDIRRFVRRGGKLIMYHGWNDAAVSPFNTVRYFEAARQRSDPGGNNTRLFMAPGMGHCFAGPGPNTFDMLPELDRWVEQGPPPEQVIASKYPNDLFALLRIPQKALRTRPLCAWPKVARYKGMGSTDDAANFTCDLPQ